NTSPTAGALTLVTAAGGSILGNPTTGSLAPVYTVTPVLGIAGSVAGSLGLASSSGAGVVTLVAVPGATNVNVQIPDKADTLVNLTGSQSLSNKTYNGLTLTAASTGFTIAGGTTSKTLTISNTLAFAGTDASTLNIGTGGTLGALAFGAWPGSGTQLALTNSPSFTTPSLGAASATVLTVSTSILPSASATVPLGSSGVPF